MKKIKKNLVFHFYIGKEGINTESNDLHFKCLKHYMANVFDNILFVIVVDDAEQQKEEILAVKNKVIDIFKSKTIEFKVKPNTYLRDSQTFYDEIATKLDKIDGLVFFAHNKGYTNLSKFKKEDILKWVAAMYFACFDDMDEVENSLTEQRKCAFGGLLNQVEKWLLEKHQYISGMLGKYSYLYTGTFFWLNPKTLLQYMANNDVELPQINDRWYAENFLANIGPANDICTSPNDWYALNYLGAHGQITDLFEIAFTSEKLAKLNKFCTFIGVTDKKDMKIEIVYIATNNYIIFLKDFLDTLQYFYPGVKKVLKVITNNDISVKSPCEDVVRCDVIKMFDLFYPCINLHKTKFIEQLKFDDDSDYVFYFDADTRFINNPDYNWDGLKKSMDKGFFLMSVHPIYVIKDEEYKKWFLENLWSAGITDKNPSFAPYIPAEQYTYVISSFFCGRKETVLHVCKGINEMIMSDMCYQKGYHIPRFSDENYFNKLVYNRENNLDNTYCIRVDFFNCIESLDNESHPSIFLYQKGGDENLKSAKR